MNSPSDTRSLLTEGVLLAVASAYVYFITFVYEYGFCSYFGVPASLIAPNVSTFLIAAVALGVTLLPALQFLAFTTPLFKAARDPNRRAYRDVYAMTAVLLVVGILLAAIYGISLVGVALYVGASLAFLAFLFLPAILSDRHLPISERLSKHADIQDEDPFVATNLFEGWVSYRNMRIGLIVFVAFGFAYLAGDAEARHKKQFVALKADQDMVLLRTYGDLLIFTKIDKEAHAQSLRLLWLSEKKELDLVTRKVGPITLAPSESIRQNEAASVPSAAAAASVALGTAASEPAK